MAINVTETLIRFNSNNENRKIMNFYNRKSYMELLGIARGEESHSSFLAWLLDGKDIECNKSNSAMMWFLQLLVARKGTIRDTSITIPNDLISHILSETLKFDIEEVKTEKKVKEVNGQYFKTNNISTCEDELDIYIKLSIRGLANITQLEIIVENKILSQEEGPKVKNAPGYNGMHQTVRYYYACSSNIPGNTYQFYVYLTPSNAPESESDKYIQITYQDILDYILTPMINNSNSERIRLILNEYIDCLSLPTLDVKESKRIVLARRKEEEQALQKFKKRNKDLLFEIRIAQLKNLYGVQLSNDELILIDFASANGNLLYAVSNDTLPNTTNTPTYLVYPELKTYDNANFGFHFAEVFALNKEKNVSNVADLNNEMHKAIRCKTVYHGRPITKTTKNIPKNREIQSYNFTLYANTDSWSQGKLSKVETFLGNSYIFKYVFKYVKIDQSGKAGTY